MDKSHIAFLLAGAALASAYFIIRPKITKKENKTSNIIDFESNDYQHLKHEQLARIVKYFG